MMVSNQNILDVDIGNTRIKWRLTFEGVVVASGVCDHSAGLSEYFRESLAGKKVDRVRVASVVEGEALNNLFVISRESWATELEIAKVQPRCAGVEQGYDDYTRLGVDRWLGVLAAHNKYKKACLVVGCGTATTLDFVDARGVHLGGYIVPGLNLMRRSLFGGTDAVKVDSFVDDNSFVPGKSTEQAVNRGLLLMVIAIINESCDWLSSIDDDFQLVLCGGDGELIGRHTGVQYIYEESLVLDGLAFALP
ncbi:MAG: type III pantothenate kinase [Cellvibrionaceae bacterium]